MTPCSFIQGYQHFGGTSYLHLQGRIVCHALKNYTIIIIGKTALFEPLPSSENSARLVYSSVIPVFISLDFTTVIFFTEQGRQPCIQPPTRRTRSLYLCPTVTGWLSYTPSHWVPFSSSSMTCRATVEVFSSAFTQDEKWYRLGKCVPGLELKVKTCIYPYKTAISH
jgi:hypothetical protein